MVYCLFLLGGGLVTDSNGLGVGFCHLFDISERRDGRLYLPMAKSFDYFRGDSIEEWECYMIMNSTLSDCVALRNRNGRRINGLY